MAYNPNRDSGIAQSRSYVEIEKDQLQGMVEQYDFVLDPTRRYFAQLVYNVGSGGSGGITDTDKLNLQWLMENKSKLEGVLALTVELDTIDIPITEFPTLSNIDLNTENTIIPIYKSNTGEVKLIEITTDKDDLDGNGDSEEFLINVQGFVCGVECHTWMNGDKTTVNTTLERFLPKMTYIPKSEKYPFGLTHIFLSKYEYDLIAELPESVRKIRIIYQRIANPINE